MVLLVNYNYKCNKSVSKHVFHPPIGSRIVKGYWLPNVARPPQAPVDGGGSTPWTFFFFCTKNMFKDWFVIIVNHKDPPTQKKSMVQLSLKFISVRFKIYWVGPDSASYILLKLENSSKKDTYFSWKEILG
jgi:hypothetical protein